MKKGYAARAYLEHAIAQRDGGWDCFYCGQYANSIDHVTARFKGGCDCLHNLVFACWDCNDAKNTMPGWLFALRKCWDYEWPDPFVKPTIHWDLSSLRAIEHLQVSEVGAVWAPKASLAQCAVTGVRNRW